MVGITPVTAKIYHPQDSSKRAVGDIHTQVVTGRKWKNEEEVLKKKKSEGGGQPQIGRHTQPKVQIKQDGEEGSHCLCGCQDGAG